MPAKRCDVAFGTTPMIFPSDPLHPDRTGGMDVYSNLRREIIPPSYYSYRRTYQWIQERSEFKDHPLVILYY